MSRSVTAIAGVVVPKPHIRVLRDDFAQEFNKPWARSQGGFIARGATPLRAYTALMQAFEGFRAPLVSRGSPRR